MSVLQLKWLTNDFEKGKISREEFESLFTVINRSEKAAQKSSISQTGKALRLHPITRRVLCQLRIYRKLTNVINYVILLSVLSFVYLCASYYKETGSLPELSLQGFTSILSQITYKPLPRDVELAAEFLSSEAGWNEEHIRQFLNLWQALDPKLKQQYQETIWYRSFLLSLSLQITEQRTLAKRGDVDAIQKSLALVKMEHVLENKVI